MEIILLRRSIYKEVSNATPSKHSVCNITDCPNIALFKLWIRFHLKSLKLAKKRIQNSWGPYLEKNVHVTFSSQIWRSFHFLWKIKDEKSIICWIQRLFFIPTWIFCLIDNTHRTHVIFVLLKVSKYANEKCSKNNL